MNTLRPSVLLLTLIVAVSSQTSAQPVPCGASPYLDRVLDMSASPIHGVAWQQGSLWTVDAQGTLRRIDPLTGAILETLETDLSTHNGLGSDGTTLWMSYDPGGNTYIKPVLPAGPGGPSPTLGARDLSWQGDTMWYADFDTDSIVAVSSSGEVTTFPSPTGTSSFESGIEWDGEHIIHVEHDRSILYLVDPSTGMTSCTVDLEPLGIGIAGGIAWNGTRLFAADGNDLYVIGFDAGQPCSTPWHKELVAPTSAYSQLRGVDLEVRPDGSEHVLYFWDDFTGGRGEMRYISRSPGAAWNPALVEVIGGNGSHRPSLAVDASGNAFCGLSLEPWECVYTSGAGSAWQQFACSLSGDFGKGGQGGVVAMTASDVPVFAYFQGPDEDARFAEWSGSAWVDSAIETAGRVGKGICIDLTPDDRPVVAYLNQDTSSTHFAERSGLDNVWSVVPFAQSDPMDVLVTDDGDVYLLTRGPNQAPPLALWHRAGATWSSVSDFPGSSYEFGQLAADSSGNVAVAALTAGHAIEVISQTSNGWETCPITTGAGTGHSPDIAFTASDSLVIAYRGADDQIWIAREPAGTWVNLGSGLAGTYGVPELTGTGSLLPGTTVQIALGRAREWSLSWMIVGMSAVFVPFKGGTLAPSPHLIVPMFTDGLGMIELDALWPAGVPSDTSVFLQFWIVDQVGPKGYAASNGLEARTP